MCFDEHELRHLHLLFPCGHRCVCAACAAVVLARPLARRLCPICDAAIIGSTAVFDI